MVASVLPKSVAEPCVVQSMGQMLIKEDGGTYKWPVRISSLAKEVVIRPGLIVGLVRLLSFSSALLLRNQNKYLHWVQVLSYWTRFHYETCGNTPKVSIKGLMLCLCLKLRNHAVSKLLCVAWANLPEESGQWRGLAPQWPAPRCSVNHGYSCRLRRGPFSLFVAKGYILSIWIFLVSFEKLLGGDNPKFSASEIWRYEG